jgi:ribose 5-phosphate isomerase B
MQTSFNASLPVAIGADHAGFEYKELIKKALTEAGCTVADKGTYNTNSTDYPDYAHPVAEMVETQAAGWGVLICGSGNGVCMTANKHPQVRAALCWTAEIAALARQHNNANIVCIPARFISVETAQKIIETFRETPFEGGRHERRVEKIAL